MSIMVATPCYGMQLTEPFKASCEILGKEFRAAGVEHDFLTIGNESLITRARNVCAASFLTDTKFACLLFIDADIEFQPADVARLWNLCYAGADVAVGAYRKKRPNATLSAWVDGKQLVSLAGMTQPFDVSYAGTGFLMVRRQTLEKLIELHPDWEYEEGMPEDRIDQPESEIENGKCWAFFQDPIENCETGRHHLSEDYFFCKRVREAGMRVIMDPMIKLKHWGLYAY